MNRPVTNISIDELSFSLFQRPLHPELFDIFEDRSLKTENYEAKIWVTGCTHVISVNSGDIYLSEVVSAPGQVLPERGLVERFHFHGPKTHKLNLSRGASYMTDFQIEKMSEGLYQQSFRDLKRFARNRGLFVNFTTDENSELNPFCYIDFEARQNELHVHSFSAYPEQVTIIKTQSLFEFH